MFGDAMFGEAEFGQSILETNTGVAGFTSGYTVATSLAEGFSEAATRGTVTSIQGAVAEIFDEPGGLPE